ncbi:tRNA-splicing endonuclease subunit Sen15 [Pelodytes ibericus]
MRSRDSSIDCTVLPPVVMDATSSPSTETRNGEATWIQEHPQFKHMMSLDVTDSVQVYAAFLVYMDLLEVRNWHDVQIFGSTELHLVYLWGQEKVDHTPQVIIPTPVSISHSHEKIQKFIKLGEKMTKAASSEEDEATPLNTSIILAVVESDSTVVYYSLTDGFVIPEPPDFEDEVAFKRGKKKRVKLLR